MKRRAFLGTALVGLPLTGAYVAQPRPRGRDIPTTTLGTSGIEVQVIAQGGARMDLQPDVPSAAKFVREVYDLGVRYFDCARAYWNGRSEEAYGIGLEGIRKNVFLTSKACGRTAEAARKDLETSLRLLRTDYIQPVALTQSHHLPALRAEPAGHANRHLRVRHGRTDGRQHPGGAELPEDVA